MDFASLILKADSSQLKTAKTALDGVAKSGGIAEEATTKLGKSLQKYLGFAAISGAAYLATREILNMAKAMDEVAKESQRVGVTVEGLQELRYAAELSGVSTSQLSTSLGFLNKNLDNNEKTLRALGVTTHNTNGSLRNAEDILPDLADKFSQMADGAEKSKLAQELFSRGGAEMIPLLNQGSAGLADMAAEARKLGIVFGNDTARNAELFNDNLTRLSKVKQGLVTQLTSELLPAFVGLSDEFVNNVKEGEGMTSMAQQLAETIKGGVSVLLTLYYTVKSVADVISTALALSVNSIIAGLKTLWDATAGLSDGLVKLFKGDFKGALDSVKNGFANAWDSAALGAEMAANMISDAAQDVANNVKAAQDQIGALYKGADPERIKELGNSHGTLAQKLKDQEAATKAAEEAQRRLADLMKEGERVTQSMLNPLERLAQTEEKLNQLVSVGAITRGIYTRAMQDANEEYERGVQAQIDAIEKAEQLKADAATRERDSLYNGLLTEEEAIWESYNKRNAMILAATSVSEEEKTELMLRATAQRDNALLVLANKNKENTLLVHSSLYDSLGSISDAFGGRQTKFYKGMFALSKGFAIADSIMKIQQGFAASASVGFPQNIATIAGHAATTAGLLAQVKSVSFAGKFGDGGTIPAGQYGLVGERGKPELVQGPATVTSGNDTAKMLNGGTTTINLYDQSGGLTETFRSKLRSHEFDTVVDDIASVMKQRGHV